MNLLKFLKIVVSFLTEILTPVPRFSLVIDLMLFFLYTSKTQSNLEAFLTTPFRDRMNSTSAYSPYVIDILGAFMTKTAPSATNALAVTQVSSKKGG